MNNNIDNLFKLLVPAIFLILWALNQLFNKENNPQAGRPGGSLGPRPGSRPATIPPRPAPGNTRPEVADPRNPYAASRTTPPTASEDGIVILRSETVRPPTAPRTTPKEPRRNPRNRPARSGQAPGDGRSGRAAREPRRESPEPRPAVVPNRLSPSQNQGPPLLIGVTTPITATEMRRALTQKERIREAVLISELLRPPVAMRRGRQGLRLL